MKKELTNFALSLGVQAEYSGNLHTLFLSGANADYVLACILRDFPANELGFDVIIKYNL
jgi:hypothetical protein